MQQTTKKGPEYVLKTRPHDVQVLQFIDARLSGTFTYRSRAAAIRALEKMAGRAVDLRPMQTAAIFEHAKFGQPLEDITQPDE